MTEDLSAENLKRRRTGRTILLVMLVLFSAPYIGSFLLYNYGAKFNIGTTNYGVLINPRVPLEELNFKSIDDQKIKAKNYQEKWIMIAIGSSECTEACKTSLFKMRQIRKAMAVERAWVKRAYALLDTDGLTALNEFMKDYEGTDLFKISDQSLKNLEEKLNIEPGTIENRMLLVDPQGDVILVYPQAPDHKGITGDLQKLFKVTKRD